VKTLLEAFNLHKYIVLGAFELLLYKTLQPNHLLIDLQLLVILPLMIPFEGTS